MSNKEMDSRDVVKFTQVDSEWLIFTVKEEAESRQKQDTLRLTQMWDKSAKKTK